MSYALQLHKERQARLARMAGKAIPTPEAKPEDTRKLPVVRASEIGRCRDIIRHLRRRFKSPLGLHVVEIQKPDIIQMRERFDDILNEVSTLSGVTTIDIKSRRRAPAIVRARHKVWFELSTRTHASLPEIGKYFNGMDHTTVMAGIKKHVFREAQAA